MKEYIKQIEGLIELNKTIEPRSDEITVSLGGLLTALHKAQEHVAAMAKKVEPAGKIKAKVAGVVALVLCAFGLMMSQAGTITLGGSPQVWTGNSTSAVVTVTTASGQMPAQWLSVQVATNFVSTNDAVFYGQVSLDGSNFVTISTFQCPATNTGTYTWTTALTNMPVYGRVISQGTNTARAVYLLMNN